MATGEAPDSARSVPDGLHNLLTGLTLQSPSAASSPTLNPTMANANQYSMPTASSIEQTLFTTPNRSIFSSGPPTSSVSVSTAQASLSGAVLTNSSRPLAALTATSSNTSRTRGVSGGLLEAQGSSTPRANGLGPHRAEKDIDDPSTPIDLNAQHVSNAGTTPTAITRLFAATNSAGPSRQPSYNMVTEYTRAITEIVSLPEHLYNRGFRDGRHSDIIIRAFSNSYALHRLLLDRSPFFSSALSEPWLESTAKEIELHPEDIDPNITQKAFEIALKRLYGYSMPSEEQQEAAGLLATGCWLEMADLVDSSAEMLMRQMTPANLASVIDLVTKNCYGKAGDRLLAAARSMLAREGWEMPLRYWDGIAPDLIRRTVSADRFYVRGEWERWILAKRLLNRRLKFKVADGSTSSSGVSFSPTPPGSSLPAAFDSSQSSTGSEEDLGKSIYQDPDIAPLMHLLEYGVHYIHMTYEQLQYIQGRTDILGSPVVRSETLLKALWYSTELRQKILNVPETAVELGMKRVLAPRAQPEQTDAAAPEMAREASAESRSSAESDGASPEKTVVGNTPSAPWLLQNEDSNVRTFWIPSCDSSRVVGARAEASCQSMSNAAAVERPKNAFLPTPGRDDETDPFLTHLHNPGWTLSTARSQATPARSPAAPTEKAQKTACYTDFPPFRFAVEFHSPRMIKIGKRVYSRTVWYAGSMWNVYIQKIQGSKNMQLGVYLHRVRDRDGDGLFSLSAAGPRSVDEAIGQLEREMFLRRADGRMRNSPATGSDEMASALGSQAAASSASGGGGGGGGSSNSPFPIRTDSKRGGLTGLMATRKGTEKSVARSRANRTSRLPLGGAGRGQPGDAAADSDDDDDIEEHNEVLRRLSSVVPGMPPYVDSRPTIRTYFKIYQMSPDGKTMSVHKSAGDDYNFSQSWGWKSLLDETILGEPDVTFASITGGSGSINGGNNGGVGSNTNGSNNNTAGVGGSSKDRLRFCIALGNL